MPPVQRYSPAWKQIADHFKGEILAGNLVPGDQLPTVREVRDRWGVSQGTAQQAYAHLHLAEHLVRTEPGGGTYVDVPRAVAGPQQRLRLAGAGREAEVLSAGLVPAPAYLVTVLELPPGSQVIRRETVTRRPGGAPYMLSVSWVPPQYALPVPELLHAAPLPGERGAARLIAERTGVPQGQNGAALEARLAKDDGREVPLLGLSAGAFVLAGIHVWTAGGEVTEYEEYVMPAGQVIEFELEP